MSNMKVFIKKNISNYTQNTKLTQIPTYFNLLNYTQPLNSHKLKSCKVDITSILNKNK